MGVAEDGSARSSGLLSSEVYGALAKGTSIEFSITHAHPRGKESPVSITVLASCLARVRSLFFKRPIFSAICILSPCFLVFPVEASYNSPAFTYSFTLFAHFSYENDQITAPEGTLR